MTTDRIPFIDWMKAVGMLLIILGHTGANSLFRPTDPINFKQLGVACFVFVTGYTLAKDTRPVCRMLYNRLFEVYLFGVLIALVISAITYLTSGNLCESNYTPFLIGSNVLFNNFPANPTTWYIGTYLHLLLVWAVLLRKIRIHIRTIVAVAVAAIVVRAVLFLYGCDYVAYQLLTNWMTVLLLGMWAADHDRPVDAGWRVLAPLTGLVIWVMAWTHFSQSLDFRFGNPFMHIPGCHGPGYELLVSVSVSLLYIVHTWLFYEVARRLPNVTPCGFLARNTLIVFIAHFPLFVMCSPYIYAVIPASALRVLVNVLLYLVVLSFVSELVRRTVRPGALKNKIWTWCSCDRN